VITGPVTGTVTVPIIIDDYQIYVLEVTASNDLKVTTINQFYNVVLCHGMAT
jgi:hypothetical protein